MKRRKICFFIAFAIVMGFTCSTVFAAESSGVKYSATEKVLEYNYTNYAWGHRNEGWYIKGNGEIVKYSQGINTGGVLEEKTVGQISLKVLDKNYALLKKSMKGKVTKPVQAGADMGSYTYKGFVSVKGETKEIMLEQTGDFKSYNTSVYAQQLVKWMKNVKISE